MQMINPIVSEAHQHQLISPAEAEYVLRSMICTYKFPLIPAYFGASTWLPSVISQNGSVEQC
jgi:hypothetical protein